MLKCAEIASHEMAHSHYEDDANAPLRKGKLTRKAIIEEALHIAFHDGLEAVSFGSLAERLQMSKAGVFAHFGSMQALQTEVLRQYCVRFEERVVYPSLSEPRGLPRLQSMFSRWARHVVEYRGNGCLYIGHAADYDERSGSMLSVLRNEAMVWRRTLEGAVRRAIKEGHLRKDTDAKQLAYEMSALIFGLHHDTWFMRDRQGKKRADRAFTKLLDGYRPAP